MYLGITAHHDALRVHDYTTAQAALERATKTPTGRQRKLKLQGYHLGLSSNHGVTWARPNEDGSIAFTLYATDVVTWYPDNSFVVDNFGSVTTSGFARRFLPSGIYLRHPVERQGVLGGDRGVVYPSGAPSKVTTDWGEYLTCPHSICFGGEVRFCKQDDLWLPDEETLADIDLPEPTRGTRGMAAKYHLRDFDNWLVMAPLHMRVEHQGEDIETCIEALRARDFRTAAEHLPLCPIAEAWGRTPVPLKIVTPHWQHVVTSGSLRKLKLALWDAEGLITTMPHKTLPLADYERKMRRVRTMRGLGLSGAWQMGIE
jgi:hypothetical protein